ncbi:hypothetical protein K2X85_18900 [bacterium]|nr:hypothetical protein [bacterium]
MTLIRNLLYVDGFAGATAGALVVLASRWLSEWYGLPLNFVIFMGIVNLAYATYSLSLAQASVRPISLILLLVVANLTWMVFCFGFAGFFFETASPFGITHLAGEGVFVGFLAALEWQWRDQLRYSN